MNNEESWSNVPFRYLDGAALPVPRGKTPTSLPLRRLGEPSLSLLLLLLPLPGLLVRRRPRLDAFTTLFFAILNFLAVQGGNCTGTFAFIAGWKLSCTVVSTVGGLNGRIEMVWLAAIGWVEGGRFGISDILMISKEKRRRRRKLTGHVFRWLKGEFRDSKHTFIQLM